MALPPLPRTSSVESVVEELEDYVATKSPVGGDPKVPFFVGSTAGAAATNIERVVWVPTERLTIQPVTGQPLDDNGRAVKEKQTLCVVSFYAASQARLEQIIDAVEASLDDLLSDNGYELRGPGKFFEPLAANAGWSFIRPIILRAPVFAEIWIQGHVRSTTVNVGTVGDLNADPPQTPDTISVSD
ncbi:MAG TPA: hypothetical protein VGQ38_15335 [Gaiellaceae bacterium]|jgi:hypothetical protein|nr:hypothetical protein [Gaiellaceae bacterium]